MRKVDSRYALWSLALLLLAGVPIFAGFTSVVWELSQMAGLIGSLACIALCGSPIRPRDSVPPTLLSLPLHALIGWAALIAVVVHAGALILSDRTVIEYLKPTAPLYQLAGIGAGVVLLVVVLSSIASVRRRLWAGHRGFQATHVILGCVLCALIAVHVMVTNRYVGGRGRSALLLAVTLGAMLMLLRFRRPSTAGTPRKHRHLVFGRHSRVILVAVAIIAVALAALLRSSAVAALREPLLSRTASIPLDFPHGKHAAVNCLICHHNYADGRGFDRCIGCHRSSRPDLKEGVEARFHGFCFECHRHPAATLSHHGPVSGCAVCHRPPDTVTGGSPMESNNAAVSASLAARARAN